MKGIAPSLAESWFMSDDNGFVTVRIRNDIKCPGGGNLNAKDVVRSFKTNRGTWGRASIYWVQSVGPLELRISPGPMVFMLAHPYTAIRCRSKEEIEKEKEEGVPGGG
jgi:ABC-type transport system substrate-binding protein